MWGAVVNIAGVVTLSHPLQDVHPFTFREREAVIVRRSPSLQWSSVSTSQYGEDDGPDSAVFLFNGSIKHCMRWLV